MRACRSWCVHASAPSGDDADAVVHKVEETIEDAERYAKEQALSLIHI